MNCFEFSCPAKIDFGVGTVEHLQSHMNDLHICHPIVVTDKILRSTSAVNHAISSLPQAPVFDAVEPNPTSNTVMELKTFVEENHGDGLIVFGGGSPMDSAKGAAVTAYAPYDVSAYYDFAPEQLPIERALPIIAIPTTAGTGSEVSQYAVITDSTSGIKRCLTSTLIVPHVALVDPAMTVDMPPKVTVSTGLDALSHAIESLLSTIENPLTNTLAFEAIRLIFENLDRARTNGSDLEARSRMSFAALIAGIAMSHCCGTMCHAMGCQLTSQYQVPHGLACAVLQRHGLDYAGDKAENIRTLMRYLDHVDCTPKEAITRLQAKLDDLFVRLETPMDLKSYSLTSEGICIMTADAMEHGCMGLNPVKMDAASVQHVFDLLR